MIQDMIQTEIFVKVSVLGDFSVTWLKMLMSTKNIVIRRPIRPGTTSRGITKLIWSTTIKVINNYNRWNILLAFYSHDPKEHVARMNIEGWKFQIIFKHIGQKCSKWTYRVLLSLNYWQVMFNKNHFLLLKWSKTAKSYWIQ